MFFDLYDIGRKFLAMNDIDRLRFFHQIYLSFILLAKLNRYNFTVGESLRLLSFPRINSSETCARRDYRLDW